MVCVAIGYPYLLNDGVGYCLNIVVTSRLEYGVAVAVSKVVSIMP